MLMNLDIYEKRKAGRLLLKHLLQIYCVVDHEKTCEVDIVDVSKSGCSLRVRPENDVLLPKHTQGMNIRLYLSDDTYLPLELKIENTRALVENGQRYFLLGCSIAPDTEGFATYQRFVEFLEMYSTVATRELGDLKVTYL